MHADYLCEVLDELGKRAIHRTVDTTLFASAETVSRVAERCELFLVDLKLMDSEKHRRYTRVPNEQILANIRMLSEMGKRFWIRIPLIVGVNADDENLNASAEFLASLPTKPDVVNLLVYHDVGKGKHARLGTEYNPDTFRDKTVLLPCDDPEWSNFTRFFAQNFERLGLRRLISTSYAVESKKYKNYQPTLFETESPWYDVDKTRIKGKIFELTRDTNGNGRIDMDDLEWHYLEGDGDFRSKEVCALRDEADIIVTNPPFSLFREFITWILKAEKKFLIVGNRNGITYKEVFPLIQSNEIWLGNGFDAGNAYFKFHGDTSVFANGVYNPETGLVKFRNCCWFTNLEHGRRHDPLRLMTMKDNLRFSKHKVFRKRGYIQYENYDVKDSQGNRVSHCEQPYLVVQTESENSEFKAYKTSKFDSDSPNFLYRVYEITGASHESVQSFLEYYDNDPDLVKLNRLPAYNGKNSQPNRYPYRFPIAAAFEHLFHWIETGIAPAIVQRIKTDGDGHNVRDALGNSIGGVRTCLVDYPTCSYYYYSDVEKGKFFVDLNSERDILFGHEESFPKQMLEFMYGSLDNYKKLVTDATKEHITKGYILKEDAEELISLAVQYAKERGLG